MISFRHREPGPSAQVELARGFELREAGGGVTLLRGALDESAGRLSWSSTTSGPQTGPWPATRVRKLSGRSTKSRHLDPARDRAHQRERGAAVEHQNAASTT